MKYAFRRRKNVLISVVIVIAILLLAAGWYQYQKHAAISYLTNLKCHSLSDTVNGSAITSCYRASTSTIQTFVFGLGAHYTYQGDPLGCGMVYSGDTVSIPGKTFVFDKKSTSAKCSGGLIY
jgi:hypothetical protein